MELNVFESGKIKKAKTFDGIEISYYYNRKGNKTIIFLHGNGSNYTTWIPLIDYFMDYSILAPDLRGHGRSGRTKNIKLESFANDVLILMDKEKISKAVLVGNSLSSSIILEFYKKYPERVEKIVLLTPFSKKVIRGSGIFNVLNKIALSISKMFRSKRRLKFQNYNKYFQQKRSLWYYPLLDIRGTSLTTYFGLIDELFKYKIDFKNINKKTLVLLGKKDFFTKNGVLINMAKDNKNIDVKMLDSHHVPLAKKYSEAIKLIEKFVK